VRFRFRSPIAACVLSVLVGGCAADAPTTPAATPTLDAALAEVAHPALDFATATFSGAGAVVPAIIPSTCQLDTASQVFVCAQVTGGWLTLDQSYVLLDAAGAKQSAFDPTTTKGVSVTNAVSGQNTDQGNTLTVDGQETLDLTGLGSARHTLNGTSLTLTTYVSAANLTHPPVQSTITTKITDLVIPVVPSGQPVAWPLSGTIATKTIVEFGEPIPSGGTSTTAVVTLTFNGSSVVTLSMTRPSGGVQTCRLNLALVSGGVGCP
jgi:hypothetical protein